MTDTNLNSVRPYVIYAFISLALMLSTRTDCTKAKVENTYPIAEKNEIINSLIPMSRAMMPPDVEQKAKQKEERILSFFRTPEQQFIPLGFYAMVHDMRNVEGLTKIRKNHINFVQKFHGKQSIENARKDLEAARQAGIGVFQNLPWLRLKEGRGFWENHISKLASDPQIIIWDLPEEVTMEELPYQRMIANIIRKYDDKNRPMITYANNYVPGYWEQTAEFTDAIIFGLYPIYYPGHPRANGKRMIDKAYQVGVPVVFKAVEALEKDGKWTKPKEVRFDTYMSLISGAKGIIFYCWARARNNEELLQEVFRISEELNGTDKLGEVFIKGTIPDGIECRLLEGKSYAPPATCFENRRPDIKFRYSSLQWTARIHQGYIYIFAVNMNETIMNKDYESKRNDIKVEFYCPGISDSTINVLYESRSLNHSRGRFVDVFESLDTHIYKIAL